MHIKKRLTFEAIVGNCCKFTEYVTSFYSEIRVTDRRKASGRAALRMMSRLYSNPFVCPMLNIKKERKVFKSIKNQFIFN